jgi:hypothetical protein
VWFAEAAGLISDIEPAAVIVERMASQAAAPYASQAGVTFA